MSQLNLATDFTVTIYSDVSAWKTETSQTLRDNTAVWREVEKKQGDPTDKVRKLA